MFKKISSKVLFICTISVLAFAFKSDEASPVHWMSFEEAVAKAKKEPRPIMIDIYTSWCGPCKLMAKNTFGDKQVADYLNKNFYCVKFDAEGYDTVKLNVTVKDTIRENGKVKEIKDKQQTIKFVNPAPKGTPKSTHQFASSILDGQMAYPSIVFLNPSVQRLNIIKGYHTKEQFEPIIRYFGSGAYQTKTYEDYTKTFTPEFK